MDKEFAMMIVGGLVFLLAAAHGLWTGSFSTKLGLIVTRSENPILFWLGVSGMFALGVICLFANML